MEHLTSQHTIWGFKPGYLGPKEWESGNTKGGTITVPLTSCLTGLESATYNFYFYLQNRLIQTIQTGGQQYIDTSSFSIPWMNNKVSYQYFLFTITWLIEIIKLSRWINVSRKASSTLTWKWFNYLLADSTMDHKIEDSNIKKRSYACFRHVLNAYSPSLVTFLQL
jgi:hypothetical protein